MEFTVTHCSSFRSALEFVGDLHVTIHAQEIKLTGKRVHVVLSALAAILILGVIFGGVLTVPRVLDGMLPAMPAYTEIRTILSLLIIFVVSVIIWKVAAYPRPAQQTIKKERLSEITAKGRMVSMKIADRSRTIWKHFFLFVGDAAVARQIVSALNASSSPGSSYSATLQPTTKKERIAGIQQIGFVRIEEETITLRGGAAPAKLLLFSLLLVAGIIFFGAPVLLSFFIAIQFATTLGQAISCVIIFVMAIILLQRKRTLLYLPTDLATVERFGNFVLLRFRTKKDATCYDLCYLEEEANAVEMEKMLQRTMKPAGITQVKTS